MRFTGLSDDLDRPAVDAFLSAVDSAMNSNTLLLKVATDVPVTAENQRQVLHAYLRSGVFEEMMLAADHRREWYFLSEPEEFGGLPNERPLIREGFLATTSPLRHAAFLARLRWMLCEAFSPYGHHRSPALAEQLVRDFVHELLGQDGSTWRFTSVKPDFLRSTGYYSGEEPLHPVYFDGSDSDTATFIHRGLVCYLLLTNGSP
ncbi:hypothetical protein [Streptomyces lydicus]|uniref:hypothetical protein n=1 Tax=Streptomyces lydicus TaxID=47763 RepID=UPI0010122CE6|nr:hypothetical protein [Streptomyces lydicus]MCZ1008156.1 hypothetical protein [Streptomyces lydicus]